MGNSSSQLTTIQKQLRSMQDELDQQDKLKRELGELNVNYNLDIQWLNYYRKEMETFQQKLSECQAGSLQQLSELQSRLDEMEKAYNQCKQENSPKKTEIKSSTPVEPRAEPKSFLEEIKSSTPLRQVEPRVGQRVEQKPSLLEQIRNRQPLRSSVQEPRVAESPKLSLLQEKMESRRRALEPEEPDEEFSFRSRQSPKNTRKSPKKTRKSPKKTRKSPKKTRKSPKKTRKSPKKPQKR